MDGVTLRGEFYRYVNAKLLTLYFAGFVGPLSANTVLALVPVLKSTFNIDVGTVLLAIPFLMLPFAFFQLFSGTLSDNYGRRLMLAIGFLIYGTGLLVIGFSPSLGFWSFLLARFVCGVGYAFIGPVLPAVIGDLTEFSYRGKVMGIYSSVNTSAITLGPLLAGFFAYSWWNIYFMMGAMAYTSMLLVWLVLKDAKPKGNEYSIMQVFSDLRDVCSLRSVAALSAAGFMGFFSFMGVNSFLSDALSRPPFNFQPSTIGVILSMGGVVGIILSPISGHLTDKFGRGRIAYTGLAICILSLLVMLTARELIVFIISMLLFGIGGNLFWLPLNALSVELEPEKRGAVSSLFNGVRFFGYALAPYLLTPVYEDWGTALLSSFQLVIVLSMVVAFMIVPIVRYLGRQELPERFNPLEAEGERKEPRWTSESEKPYRREERLPKGIFHL
ncbi:MAG: MFS transporter [Candidatus Freyarchaeota archaeon]|nr:MFS transporter [Candidatus Jordarchaeia archaeon]